MVNIEPYDFQKKTNIKEHNDLVTKINEIVDVINNTNLDTINPRIDKIETDITGINSTDALQWQDIESVKGDISTITPKITKLEQDVTNINSTDSAQNTDISNLKTKDSEHDTRLGTIDTEINGITKSLVSSVAILNGTTSGNVKVRIGRKDAPSIDSDDYNIQKPTSVELIQGSAPAMVKAQITLSDGTVLISDDFMFTTEAIGQDVYISSFVFKNGNVAGTISADIGLSNGSTLTANNFVVPTDPNVTTAISDIQGRVTTVENDVSGLKTKVNDHTTSINGLDSEVSDLQTRMTAVEGGTIVGLDKLKQTVDGHTASINALDSDVANLQIDKADVNNGNQSIVAGSISANNISKGGVAVATINDIPDISGKVDKSQGVANAGKPLIVGDNGDVTIGEMPDTGLPSPYMGRITQLPSADYTGSFYLRDNTPRISIDMISTYDVNGNINGFKNCPYLYVPKPGTNSSTQRTYGSILPTHPEMTKIIGNIIDYFHKLKAPDGVYLVSLMSYNDYLKGFFNRYNTNTATSHEITINVSGDSITSEANSFIFPINANDTYIDVYIGNITTKGY